MQRTGDAIEAEDGGEEKRVHDRQGDAIENNDIDGFEALFKSLSFVAHNPLARLAELQLAVFPVAVSALAGISIDTKTLNSRVAGTRTLVRPAEPDYILRTSSALRDTSASDTDDAGNAHTVAFGGTSAHGI